MAKEEGFLEVSGLAVMARQCLCLSVGIRKAEVRYYRRGGVAPSLAVEGEARVGGSCRRSHRACAGTEGPGSPGVG